MRFRRDSEKHFAQDKGSALNDELAVRRYNPEADGERSRW
jgi:hypothetical protein